MHEAIHGAVASPADRGEATGAAELAWGFESARGNLRRVCAASAAAHAASRRAGPYFRVEPARARAFCRTAAACATR